MNTARIVLAGVLLGSSCAWMMAQENLADTYAPQARLALEQAPPLRLEKRVVAIRLPEGWQLGRISAVALGPDGVAYVLQRGDKADPVLAVDQNGRVLRSWGKGMFRIPHSIKVDPEGNVWTTDAGDGRVWKFSASGKPLQEIDLHDAPTGQDCGFPAAAVNNFIDACGTTDILFLPGGRLFLTDGYGKMRVLEYNADGKRLHEWGGRGTGRGQFRVPHGLAYDGSVLFVADRDNGRLQRFDLSGRYLGEWTHLGRVGAIAFRNGMLWAATSIRSSGAARGAAANASWVVNVDPATGKALGKIDTTNADFIDVGDNGDLLAGATGTSFTWYRPAR